MFGISIGRIHGQQTCLRIDIDNNFVIEVMIVIMNYGLVKFQFRFFSDTIFDIKKNSIKSLLVIGINWLRDFSEKLIIILSLKYFHLLILINS